MSYVCTGMFWGLTNLYRSDEIGKSIVVVRTEKKVVFPCRRRLGEKKHGRHGESNEFEMLELPPDSHEFT